MTLHPRLWLLALQTRSNTLEKTSLDLANYVKSMPSAFRVRPGSIPVGGDSGVWNGIGVPAARSLLFYFCRRIPRVIVLVFVLVSAATDDKSDFSFRCLWY